MIKNIFETKIFESFYPNFGIIKEDISTKLLNLFNKDSTHRNFGGTAKCNYWQVNGQLHNYEEVKLIVEFVTAQAKLYWKDIGYKNVDRVGIRHCWANVTPKGGCTKNHHHLPAPVSGCFYVNATPEMGNIVFEHPFIKTLAYQPWDNSLTTAYSNTIEIESMSGKLVLFPGYLNHWVNDNITDNNRIVIAFNIMPI